MLRPSFPAINRRLAPFFKNLSILFISKKQKCLNFSIVSHSKVFGFKGKFSGKARPSTAPKKSARKRAKNSEFVWEIRRESLGRASRGPPFSFSKNPHRYGKHTS